MCFSWKLIHVLSIFSKTFSIGLHAVNGSPLFFTYLRRVCCRFRWKTGSMAVVPDPLDFKNVGGSGWSGYKNTWLRFDLDTTLNIFLSAFGASCPHVHFHKQHLESGGLRYNALVLREVIVLSDKKREKKISCKYALSVHLCFLIPKGLNTFSTPPVPPFCVPVSFPTNLLTFVPKTDAAERSKPSFFFLASLFI